MIRSMTGFGAAEGEILGRPGRLEIKTINNRFREIIVRAPHICASLEENIKKLVSQSLKRGRVEIWIQLDEKLTNSKNLTLNLDLAKKVTEHLRILAQETNLPPDFPVSELLKFDVLSFETQSLDLEILWQNLSILSTQALDQLVKMRLDEGQALLQDIEMRLGLLSDWTKKLKELAASAPAAALSRYKVRLEEMAETILDPARLAQEAAILADKIDITEEITRFASHLVRFKDILDDDEPSGRRLEFLLQELGREANTMGSKSLSLTLTGIVLDIKGELEKIREQVMNIE